MPFDAVGFEIETEAEVAQAPDYSLARAKGLNVENIVRVRDFLKTLAPALFSMGNWGLTPEGNWTNDCNTPACIAGWTLRTFGRPAKPYGYGEPAGRHLGIEADEDQRALFQPTRLIPLGSGVFFSPICEATPADAVRVLDHLLLTGEVDWSVAR